MKIDYDLARNMMLAAEHNTDGIKHFHWSIYCSVFTSASRDKIRYHYKYLVDCGYLETFPSYKEEFIDITPAGRQFLEIAKNDDIWSDTKKAIQPLGEATLSLVAEIAKELFKERLGL